MPRFRLLVILLNLFFIAKAQVNVRSTTAATLSAHIPGFSQVTTYNSKTISYTASVPPADPTPIDNDTTHEIDYDEKYADILSATISTSDGNVTSTTAGKVWTLKLTITNTVNVGLSFSPLSLAAGARMYIFNASETMLIDSISKTNFSDTSAVGFPPLPGNAVVIYILEPGNTGALKSQIHINKVFAGFQSVGVTGQAAVERVHKGQTQTLSTERTEVNAPTIDCDPSSQCYPVYHSLAKSVVEIYSNGHAGTGTLVNSTLNNGRAYIFTALHVLDENKNHVMDANEIADLKIGEFVCKNWLTSCGGSLQNYQAYNGANVVMYDVDKDVIMLELINAPGIGDDVTYAGWSRSQPNNSGPVVISHPFGQDQRIAIVKQVANFVFQNQFWKVNFNTGQVDHGSSGAALLDQNGLVTGFLSKGWGNCNFQDFGQLFGKFGDLYSEVKTYLAPSTDPNFVNGLFISNTTITGPSSISCGNASQYSIPNFYHCTFSWTLGSNLTLTVGQGTSTVTVTGASASASSSVSVLITSATGITKQLTLTKSVSLVSGGPGAGTITHVNVAPSPNTQIDVSVTVPTGSSATSYKFYVDGSVVYSGNGLPAATTTMNGGGCGSHTVYLQLINNCGPTNSSNYPYTRSCTAAAFQLTPNPATSSFTISKHTMENFETNSLKAQTNTSQKQDLVQAIEVYDVSGKLRTQKTFGTGSNRSQYLISVSDLSAGIYLVKIITNTKSETHKLVVVGR